MHFRHRLWMQEVVRARDTVSSCEEISVSSRDQTQLSGLS
jgi:hypothetical protein